MVELQQIQNKITQLEQDIDSQERVIQEILIDNKSDIVRAYIEKRHRNFEMAKMLDCLNSELIEDCVTECSPDNAEENQTRELESRAVSLENDSNYQKETIQTLSEINRAAVVRKDIERKKHSVAISELLNLVAPKTKFNLEKQLRIMVLLECENKVLNRRITKAFFTEDAIQREADVKASTLFSYTPGLKVNNMRIEGLVRGVNQKGVNGLEVLVLPKAINGQKVVAIGRKAFEYMNIKEAIIPDTVTTIGVGAFRGCKELKRINLPNSLSEIQGGCFYETGLEEVALPQNVKTLSRFCFKNCTDLTRIALSNSITTIEQEALCNTKIRRIVFPESLLKVDIQALAYSKVDIACMGMETTFDIHGGCNLEGCRNYTIYCLPYSAMEKQCRKRGLRVRPLNEFPNGNI